MSEDDDEPKPDYPVGYGKPPLATRFKPGESGNPNGRPKKPAASLNEMPVSRDLDLLIVKGAQRRVKVNDGVSQDEVSVLEAGYLAAYDKAAKGDVGAMKFVTKEYQASLRRVKEARASIINSMNTYKADKSTEEQTRETYDLSPDEFVIDPDDLQVDSDGNVTVAGPVDKESKEFFENMRAHRSECICEVKYINNILKVETDTPTRRRLEASHMVNVRRRLVIVCRALRRTYYIHFDDIYRSME